MNVPERDVRISWRSLALYGALGIAALVLIGIPLGIVAAKDVTSHNFWLDESGQFWLSRGLTHSSRPGAPAGGLGKILAYGSLNSDPCLFTILLRCWMTLFGTSATGLRSLPFLFLVLTSAVIVWAAFRCGTHPLFAILAGSMPLGFPLMLYFASEVRAYSMDALAVAFLFFIPCWLDDEMPGWKTMGIGIIAALLVLSRYSVFLSGAAACVTALFPLRPLPTAIRRAVTFSVPVVIAVAVAYVLFVPSLTAGTNRPPAMYDDYLLSGKDAAARFALLRENFLSLRALPITFYLIAGPLFCWFGPRNLAKLRSLVGRTALFCALSVSFAAAASLDGRLPWAMNSRWAIGFHSLSACCLAMTIITFGVWTGNNGRGLARVIRWAVVSAVFVVTASIPLKTVAGYEGTPKDGISSHLEPLAKLAKAKEMRFLVEPSAFPTVRYLCEFGPLKDAFSYPRNFHFEIPEEAARRSPISADAYDAIIISNTSLADEYRARMARGSGADSDVPARPSNVLLVTKVQSIATFVRFDRVTQGNWQGTYGADGFYLAAGASNVPAYAQVSVPPDVVTWAETTEARALRRPAAERRAASAWWAWSTLTFDVNLADGRAHQLALYCLDWDSKAREQTVEVLDGATNSVLDQRDSAGFHDGQYLIWEIAGHVKVRVTHMGGANAVASGIFLGGISKSTVTFVKTDRTTQGSWAAAYGAEGVAIPNDSTNFPDYAKIGIADQFTPSPTWISSTRERRALQKVAASDRIASLWGGWSSFTVDINLTDGLQHQIALYFLDWDSAARKETVEVLDSVSHSVLDHRDIANFHEGQYLVWKVVGHVRVRIARVGGPNAVLSGIFLGGPSKSTAVLIKQDRVTQGLWKAVYGSEGFAIPADSANFPRYAEVSFAGQFSPSPTWIPSTRENRALEKAAASGRIASLWGGWFSFSIDINLTDGVAHQIALYFLDWDSKTRKETVELLDGGSSRILDRRDVASFYDGQYLVWKIAGHVKIRVNRVGGANAVVSGLFFDKL